MVGDGVRDFRCLVGLEGECAPFSAVVVVFCDFFLLYVFLVGLVAEWSVLSTVVAEAIVDRFDGLESNRVIRGRPLHSKAVL